MHDPEHPVMIMQVNGGMSQLLISRLEEEGFHIEIDQEPTPILTVTTDKRIRQLEMTAQLVGIIKAWHDECWGLMHFAHRLLIECDHPTFKTVHHAPSEDSRGVRLGELEWEQGLAVMMDRFEEAAQLQRQINDLVATPRR
jgi:hypothetical protein